jgi:hypothetical protein
MCLLLVLGTALGAFRPLQGHFMPLQEARRSPHALPRTATAACLSLCRQLRLLRQFRLLRQLRLLGLLLLPPTPPILSAPSAPPAPCMQNVGFGGSGCGFGRAWRPFTFDCSRAAGPSLSRRRRPQAGIGSYTDLGLGRSLPEALPHGLGNRGDRTK